jgi:ATP-binding cassette, subfamily B, bacterial
MTAEHEIKRETWRKIFGLIKPYRRSFATVVFIGLLSTGAHLLEPLIYREAINDVAGLFVQQAKDDTRKELQSTVDEPDPFSDFIEKESTAVEQKAEQIEGAGEVKSKPRVKEQHTSGHVAGRTPQQAMRTLLWAVILLFFINVIAYILWRIADNLNVRLSCRIEQRFIQGAFAHVLSLPLGFFGQRSSAAIAKQIDQSEGVTSVVNAFSQQILPEVISLVGILAVMLWQNVTLTLISVAVIPVYIWIAWRSSTKLELGLNKYYERWEDVSGRITDALSGIKTVKLSGAETREVERLQHLADDAYKDYVLRTVRANKYIFWEEILTRLSTALVLGYGGYLTLEHRLTPGDVVMFVAYLDMLYGPIDSLASLWVSLQQNVVSLGRAFTLLDNTSEDNKGKQLKIQDGKVEFKDVHFGYTPDREILKGISFTLQPGRVTALVGTSGAGKTTTVDLLMKLYEPQRGEIFIDGQSIGRLDTSSVRRQMGIVSTDGAVFRGTLAYNIRYKRPEATDAEVMAAAIAAGMQGTLHRMPDGLQTLVGDSGMGLSVGERQRIQIARVLVAKPRILILDEATANLDYATEAEVKKTIEEIRKENTVLIIAHRYSMVRDADHVIVLSAGQVVEEGAPDELIAKGGWFAGFASAADEEEENGEEIAEEDSEEMEEGD